MTTPSTENLFSKLRQASLKLQQAKSERDLAESILNDRLDQVAWMEKEYRQAILDIEDAAKVGQ